MYIGKERKACVESRNNAELLPRHFESELIFF